MVEDQAGSPVAGAALRVGDELAFTDSRGEFFVRMKKAKDYPLTILYEEFLGPVRYEEVFVPARVTAQPEAQATPVSIVLRRRANQETDSSVTVPLTPPTPR
jgi:hypothetical protein